MLFLLEQVITQPEHLLKPQQRRFNRAAQRRLYQITIGLVLTITLIPIAHGINFLMAATSTPPLRKVSTVSAQSAVLQFN